MKCTFHKMLSSVLIPVLLFLCTVDTLDEKLCGLTVGEEGKDIQGNNVAMLNNVDEKGCKAECMIRDDCKSIDWEPGRRKCYMNGVTQEEVSLRNHASSVYYQKVCRQDCRETTGTPHVTYIPGTLPIILSAPHGGYNEPSNIPNRDAGCYINGNCVWRHDCGTKDSRRCKATTGQDMFTYELAMQLHEELHALTGQYPYVVLNELHRRKFDANRDKSQATFDVPEVEDAWEAYNAYIERAKADIGGRGIFFDIHGHSHAWQAAEIGYTIRGYNLDSGNFQAEDTSIRNLASHVGGNFDDLLRGAKSFGGFLQDNGYDSVPGPVYRSPNGKSYFSGGFLTQKHGSRYGGVIDAIQIESARSLREDLDNYVPALADAMVKYMTTYYTQGKK